jgi:AraC-like DNA-binding protein
MSSHRFAIDPAWRMLIGDLKLDLSQALRRAELPPDLFRRNNVHLSLPEYLRLWRAMEHVLGSTAFPVELVPRLRREGFDPAIFAAFCSPNLNAALKRLSRFKALVGPMSLNVEIAADATTLAIDFHGVAQGGLPASLVGAEIVFFVHLARAGSSEPVRPLRVEVPVALGDAAAYADFLGIAPVAGDRIRIRFAAADAKQPFISSNEAMWAHFEPALVQRLSALSERASMRERVRASLLEALPGGTAGVAEVARKLLMSTRTMQRRLGDEGSSFNEVLREVRAELATHYLTRSSMSGAQIAYLLGFDNPNSFSRAFHVWTGSTPEQIRSAALH